MVYIDEQGNVLERVDLNLGYLVDAEWTDHPETKEEGHYEYEEIGRVEGGDGEPIVSRLQRYVVDVPYAPAWREVTVQKFVAYTEEELAILARRDSAERLCAVEAHCALLEDCLLEMSELVYA